MQYLIYVFLVLFMVHLVEELHNYVFLFDMIHEVKHLYACTVLANFI